MLIIAIVVSVTALGVAVHVSFRLSRWNSRVTSVLENAPTEPYDDQFLRREVDHLRDAAKALEAAQEDLEVGQKDLMIAVAEGIERVDRSERRVRAAVASAKKRLNEAGYEDPTLEAEAEGLRLVHGGGGEKGGLSAVPEDLGEDQDSPTGEVLRYLPGNF